MSHLTRLCALALLFTAAVAHADQPTVLRVWPAETVQDSGIGYYGKLGPEHVRDPDNAPTKDAKWITSVTVPTITVFRPSKSKSNGTALLICPGGGYWNLAWDLEGEEVAQWAAQKGMTAIVLKYRVPRRQGTPEPMPAPGPLLDAQRALSLVRSRSKEWNIDPNRIGVVGFSAGGHLAVALATNFDRRGYEPIDAVDAVSCRPNFAVSVYPGYLVAKSPQNRDTEKLADYIRIPADTPPIMLVHAADDKVSSPDNSVVMFQALQKAGVSSELHLFAKGGHGFGVRKSALPCSKWAERMVEWLLQLGLIGKPR